MLHRNALVGLLPVSVAAALLVLAVPAAESRSPQQSPINVTADSIHVNPKLAPLRITYGHSDLVEEYVRKDADSPTGCTTRQREETEEDVVTPGTAYVSLAGVRYDLVQFHFHTPSEHKFEGRSDPLEMHFVHRDAGGHLLVIGVPLRVGSSSEVDTVLAKLAPECGEAVQLPDIDLNSLLPANRTTIRYDGSLTTAPFTEGVQWILMREKTVSQETISRFQSLFTSGNARESQPLNGRVVQREVPHV